MPRWRLGSPMPLDPQPADSLHYDYALVGGGLQNALIALAIRHHQPQASILLVEQQATLGGNHTWCFHFSDVAPAVMAWLRPLVAHQWPGYEVRFADFTRRLPLGYGAMTSAQLAEVVTKTVLCGPGAVLLNTEVSQVAAHQVVLADGRTLHARLVVDARGAQPEAYAGRAGWQKFVGLEVQTVVAHGLVEPILMDAQLPQMDGFRFMYVLPLDAHRLLVEDTRFADGADLDVAALRAEVLAYAQHAGWQVAAVLRQEVGVLPMPWKTSENQSNHGVLVAGMQGGWFHPATGYSLAVAARLAQWLGSVPPDQALGEGLRDLEQSHGRQRHFAHAINWALFHLAAPPQRVGMMARFFRRPEAIIARFFALDLQLLDIARIILGPPPRGMRWWPRSLALEVTP